MPILVGTPYALSQSMKAMGFSPLGKLTRSPSRKRNGKGDPPRQTNGTSPAMVFRVIFLILLSTLGVILVIALTHSDKDVRLAIDGECEHIAVGDMLLGGAISPDGATLAIVNAGSASLTK